MEFDPNSLESQNYFVKSSLNGGKNWNERESTLVELQEFKFPLLVAELKVAPEGNILSTYRLYNQLLEDKVQVALQCQVFRGKKFLVKSYEKELEKKGQKPAIHADREFFDLIFSGYLTSLDQLDVDSRKLFDEYLPYYINMAPGFSELNVICNSEQLKERYSEIRIVSLEEQEERKRRRYAFLNALMEKDTKSLGSLLLDNVMESNILNDEQKKGVKKSDFAEKVAGAVLLATEIEGDNNEEH